MQGFVRVGGGVKSYGSNLPHYCTSALTLCPSPPPVPRPVDQRTHTYLPQHVELPLGDLGHGHLEQRPCCHVCLSDQQQGPAECSDRGYLYVQSKVCPIYRSCCAHTVHKYKIYNAGEEILTCCRGHRVSTHGVIPEGMSPLGSIRVRHTRGYVAPRPGSATTQHHYRGPWYCG